jgi:hypothetical protein
MSKLKPQRLQLSDDYLSALSTATLGDSVAIYYCNDANKQFFLRVYKKNLGF